MPDITVTSTILGFGTIPTTSSTTATYNGVTFTFDTSMPVGYFFDGEPFVVSSSAFNITAISPASAVVSGTQAHGAMQDPLWGKGESQGFEELWATGGTGLTASVTAYSAALNVDPAVNGSIAISQGQETSIVKCTRLSGATNADWHSIEKYVTLTVLASAPAPGTVMPSPSATTKKLYNVADVDLSVTRSITMPASFLGVSANATAALADVPDYLAHWGLGGEHQRRYRLDEALNGSNYSAYLVDSYAYLLLHLHSSATTKPDKYQIAARVLRHAAQIEALYDHYGAFPYDNVATGDEGLDFGAGQGGGLHMWIWAGAFLLKNTTLLTKAQAIISQAVSPHWLTSSLMDGPIETGSGQTPQPVLPEQVGLPEISPEGLSTHIDSPYTSLGAMVAFWEGIACLPLYNFSGGDWSYHLTGGVHDTTNDKAAVIALMDRVRTWNTIWGAATSVPQVWKDLYDTLRSYSTMSQWSGQPEQVPWGTNTTYDDDAYFVAGDGQIAWDFLSLEFATESVTRRDFRYSLDGVQWVTDSGVATSGTKTGLLKGVTHWLGLRQASASGNGAWSGNFPYNAFVDVDSCSTLSGTTPSFTNGDWKWTLSGASTPTDGLSDDQDATLWIDNTGNHSVTWPTITWVGNNATEPTLKSGLNLVILRKTSGVLYGELERGIRTTSGTDSATAPANTTAPKIHSRTYSYWEYPIWEEASSPLGASSGTKLSAGVGYWSGYPAPTYAYVWKRDGTPIGGATSKEYTTTVSDSGTDITCEVTATNASGSAAVTTAAVSVPA